LGLVVMVAVTVGWLVAVTVGWLVAVTVGVGCDGCSHCWGWLLWLQSLFGGWL
jgi:hypothetical protein